MANADSVAQFYLDSFGQARIGIVSATPLNTAGNAVVTIPLLGGGLTNSTTAGASGAVIIRRVSVMNPSGSMSSTYVSITTSNDGNASNAIVSNAALSSITGVNTFQDMTVAGGNVVVNGNTTSALYVNVNVVAGNSNTAEIRVYGDVVRF
jgi:hypothetical protein